jgi:hypothetical protein
MVRPHACQQSGASKDSGPRRHARAPHGDDNEMNRPVHRSHQMIVIVPCPRPSEANIFTLNDRGSQPLGIAQRWLHIYFLTDRLFYSFQSCYKLRRTRICDLTLRSEEPANQPVTVQGGVHQLYFHIVRYVTSRVDWQTLFLQSPTGPFHLCGFKTVTGRCSLWHLSQYPIQESYESATRRGF